MVYIYVSKTFLASLFCYSLANTTVTASPKVSDYPDVGVSASRLSFKSLANLQIESINGGSLFSNSSGVNFTAFVDIDCKGAATTIRDLLYGVDQVYLENLDWTKSMKFTSFDISRSLKKQEQLDLSTMGQDKGQNRIWNCGAFMMSYRERTTVGCYNIPKGEVASCVRLWYY